MRPYLDLFFMGAAFLLLETKNVVQFALLFGTTWFVNALVFVGDPAGRAAGRRGRRGASGCPGRRLLYCCCRGPRGRLAGAAGVAARAGVAPRSRAPPSALAFAPVFLANLVFAQRFRDVGASTVAFGANLLGAMVGGVLEYVAIVMGYRNLLLLVAMLYALAFVTGRHHLGGLPPRAGPADDVIGVPGTAPQGSTPAG